MWNGWWFRNPANHLRYGQHPIVDSVLCIQRVGFLAGFTSTINRTTWTWAIGVEMSHGRHADSSNNHTLGFDESSMLETWSQWHSSTWNMSWCCGRKLFQPFQFLSDFQPTNIRHFAPWAWVWPENRSVFAMKTSKMLDFALATWRFLTKFIQPMNICMIWSCMVNFITFWTSWDHGGKKDTWPFDPLKSLDLPLIEVMVPLPLLVSLA